MVIEIYHGSDHIIEKPELGKGRLKNDYGKGFYCTEERGLTGAGLATEDNIFTFFNGKGNIFQRCIPSGCGVGKAEILDLEMCHWMVSLICKITGISR